MSKIILDDLPLLKKEYLNAVKEKKEYFSVLLGKAESPSELYTPYAKYLIEYLESIQHDLQKKTN
jgi:hypothetical protein